MSEKVHVDDLLSKWQQRWQQGHDAAPEELCRDCPDLLPELRGKIEALRQMNRLVAAVNTSGQNTPTVSAPPLSAPKDVPRVQVPGYAFEGMLGRGGMGVVYKARHLPLKRLVALKMILAGPQADAEQLARFRLEAEAIARLQHPHIVQIFDSGTHDGIPWFALEFVAGGSLDHLLAGRPQAPGDAARLVLLLAQAVHAAHQKDVIHRDLKPANVLLAPPADEPALNCAWGCPKITDFGLAKLLGEAQGPTVSGMAVGTPMYMAPEQVQGLSARMGPATDVYALGAILYEVLTGRPPFRGANLAETLLQVSSRAPTPPRELQADIPLELEAICLKCLAKKPGGRYASAAALAEDLRRFLDQQPTVARPARPWWRRPLVLGPGLAAAVLMAIGLVVGLRPWGAKSEPPGRPRSPGDVMPPSPRAEAPLEGELTLRINKAGKQGGSWWRVDQKGALPVRPGDLVRVEVKLNQPAYVYLLLLASEGSTVPLYPWNEDKIQVKEIVAPPQRGAQALVHSPVGEGLGWPFDKHGGLETILMLARRTPLPETAGLAAELRKVPSAPLRNKEELGVLDLHGGEASAATLLAQHRGIEDEARQVDDPLLRLMERLRPQFELVRAVRFAHEGD
jgi:hypothetical protein